MAKRNKKFRSNRSALKLEALEQRQLLATIVGGSGGTEVGSDITVSGKVYDQILMTGSTITVSADPGQIVRVDWMDADGDIVRAEFSGAGQLNISLGSFAAAAAPTKYTGITTKYVSGLASFTITGSDATSNFLTTSLGPVTAFNGLLNPIFANGTTVGGNNTANVSRLVIIGDSTNLIGGAGTAFGSVFAGNATFSDSSGVVGIYAPNTSFKTGSTVTIGDIVPVGTQATPILSLGQFSDVKVVTVAGGKLASVTGGVAYVFNNVLSTASTTGTNSKGDKLDTLTLSNSVAATYSSGLGTVTVDGSTATSASLDALYNGKYLQDVVINNGLPAGVVFRAFQFGNVTVNGNLAGVITTDANNNNLADAAEQAIGNVTINGSIVDGGYIESSTSIGNVTVTGNITHTTGSGTITVGGTPGVPNQIAVISTLGRAATSAAIGNVSVTGDITIGTSTTPVAEGLISSGRALTTANASTALAPTGGIGNISGANLTVYSSLAATGATGLNGTNGNAGIINHAGSSGQSIGTVTFTGDVVISNTTAGAAGFIASSRNIGAISAKSLTMETATTTAGIITGRGTAGTADTNGNIGAITTTGTGGITVIKGVISANGNGSVGNLSVGGTGNLYLGADTAGTVNANTVGISGGSVGNISVTSGNMKLGSATATIKSTNGNIGSITLSAGVLTQNGVISAVGGNVGDLTLTDTSAAASTSTAKIQAQTANGVGGAVGNVTVTKGDLTFNAGGGIDTLTAAGTTIGNITLSNGNLTLNTATSLITAATKIGDINVKGNITFGAAGAQIRAGATTGTAGTSIGNITVAANTTANTTGKIVGADGNTEFLANQIGNVSVTGGAGATLLLPDVIFSARGSTQATIATAKIGDITLNSSANSTGDIASSTSASVSVTTGVGFSSSGNVGNVTLTTGTGAGAEIITGANTGFIIQAGSAQMGLAPNVSNAATATTAVGNGFAVNVANAATTDINTEAVSIGNVTINGIVSGGTLSANNAVGKGLIIAAGVNTVANGTYKTSTAANGNLGMPAALTTGTIGNVTISDLSGGVVKTPFSNGVLKVLTATDTGGSIIVADRITGITVNSGPGAILSLANLSGLPLKGALSGTTGVPDNTKQEYTGADASNLLIVVL